LGAAAALALGVRAATAALGRPSAGRPAPRAGRARLASASPAAAALRRGLPRRAAPLRCAAGRSRLVLCHLAHELLLPGVHPTAEIGELRLVHGLLDAGEHLPLLLLDVVLDVLLERAHVGVDVRALAAVAGLETL